MTSTLKATFLLAIISLTGSFAQAQNASLTHIFPQVVDGVGSDGTVWTSRFLGSFHITALLFDQSIFTNVVPIVIR